MKAPGQRFVSEVQDSPLLFPLALWMADLALAGLAPQPAPCLEHSQRAAWACPSHR